MKYTLLALMLFTINAYATDRNPHANAGAIGLGIGKAEATSDSASSASASNGGVKFSDKLQLPNSPGLSSGSSNTTANDYKYKQNQVSTLLGGVTSIEMELDIIGFLKYYGTLTDENTKSTFNLAACIESDKWRKLRKQQKLDCPQ